MAHNENTRVKIPAILHLRRLGYKYISLSNAKKDESTNIFTAIFAESIAKINPDIEASEIKRLHQNISLILENEDLGREFYEKLTATSGIKLIDFNNFENNAFHVVTELTFKNGEDEFRPDITLLINGMPLAFIEVKKPNNREGILAERERMNDRFKNREFRKFINQFQILVFSNNMEYDQESIVPIQGAFYATTAYRDVILNPFREEHSFDYDKILQPESDEIENFVLKDNNSEVIKFRDEFISNKEATTSTNRIITSLFSKERLAFLLKFGITYIGKGKDSEKHIMRYPQIFATKAIEKTLENGIKKGIIWHTQGSGKTALAFYNVAYLTAYFKQKGIVPKFYFIVDRLDLLTQASKEFEKRGLNIHTVNSKDELIQDFRKRGAIHNFSGKHEITVVNIQKFQDETTLLKTNDYDINTQRIYFLDEVHRSYNPKGSFLANLTNSDKNAILIGLTGTPLIKDDKNSRAIFGDYIHKYYYNDSIADGYTLKLIREGIETNYRMQLAQALKEIEVLKGEIQKKSIYAHQKFVEPMLDYIVQDFVSSRKMKFDNKNIGGMVVCDSSEQAEKLYEIFNQKYAITTPTNPNPLSSALILHTVSKTDLKQQIEDFKDGKIDLLFVYQMLLTGFDAPRLKKLYMGRIVKDHNLLQTLTRVNRPFKNFPYGYVVDFADIRKEFDTTNRAYFEELQQLTGNDLEGYANIFKTEQEIDDEIKEIKEKLFRFDLENPEKFSTQITQIKDRKQLLELQRVLLNTRYLYNEIRFKGQFDFLEKLDFQAFNVLLKATTDRLGFLNDVENAINQPESVNLLNIALENVIFAFQKVSEEELVLADKLKEILRKTREAFLQNFDPHDPKYISLREELERLFKKKNLNEISQGEMKLNIGALRQIYEAIMEQNRKDNLLKAKYKNDEKFTRVHKRIIERGKVSSREIEIHETLTGVKALTDDKVLINNNLLNNEPFFDGMITNFVRTGFLKINPNLDVPTIKYISNCIEKEYINDFNRK